MGLAQFCKSILISTYDELYLCTSTYIDLSAPFLTLHVLFFLLGRYAVGVINDIDDCVTETDIKKSYTAFKARFKKIKDYERVQFAAFKILGYNENVVSCVYV